MNLELDVRAILPAVGVPTVVVHGLRDPLFSVENGRYLAAHIPGARLIEVDDSDHAFLFQGAGHFRDALDWLIRQPTPTPASFLATVLVLDVGAVTAPPDLDDLVARHGGVPSHDGLAWSFDGPQRAIRCALILLASARAGRFRAGVHTGEVVRQQGTLRGEGLKTARAIARAAAPGEAWSSRVVRDLVQGSAFDFTERGYVSLADGHDVEVHQTQISKR
jgi:hypothetical protein